MPTTGLTLLVSWEARVTVEPVRIVQAVQSLRYVQDVNKNRMKFGAYRDLFHSASANNEVGGDG
jgi:hypothetical protein